MESKNKKIERLVKYSPLVLILVILGMYWVGSNSIVIATTVSTVDKELQGAYLERDAYNDKMKQEAKRGDSIEADYDLYRQQDALQDSIQQHKIDSLIIKTSYERKILEALANDFRDYRDSVNKVQLKRSAVEDRYRE